MLAHALQAATIKAQSTVYHASFSCRTVSSGSKECGIPIGYSGNPIGYQGLSRTGAVLYPKVSRRSQSLCALRYPHSWGDLLGTTVKC